jgi:epoxyqueuosine reductase
MAWLERNVDKRADPGLLVPGARTVICLGRHYDPPGNEQPADSTGTGPQGRMARYARGDDYHDLIKSRLAELWKGIQNGAGEDLEGRDYVDTSPVLERELAARTGLGWWGKNTMLINRRVGSYFLLAELITTVKLQYDSPATDHCGSCTRCLDACPTQAFPEPYVLDARRCISYLNIELKTALPQNLRQGMGDWLLGCDICQDVCPWNRRAPKTQEQAFHARPGLYPVDLLELITLDRDTFNERFRRNPAKRPKRRGMLRNAAVALGNAGQANVTVPVLAQVLLKEEEPLVQARVAWALGQLGGSQAREALESAKDLEQDAGVQQEISDALASGSAHSDG